MTSGVRHLGLIEDGDLSLDLAALEIAQLDHPQLDLGESLALIQTMTAAVAGNHVGFHDLNGQAATLREVLFSNYGFSGDRETYDAPGNADLIQVLQRRRGLPIALCLLYVAIARRQGWFANVLNMPGHAMVAIGRSPFIIIDPFNEGTVVVNGHADQGLMTTDAMRLDQLNPMTNRAVLIRLLTNQASRATAAGDLARALVVMQRLTSVAPDYSPAWWEMARLQVATGLTAEARLSLTSMLETTRDESVRRQVLEALGQLDN